MKITHEVMTVAEFQYRHQDGVSYEAAVSPDVVLTDGNGIPLPVVATVIIEYRDGQPCAYRECEEKATGPRSLVRYEGRYRPLS